MPTIFERLQHSWNAFRGRDRPQVNTGFGTYFRPDSVRMRVGNERSIITAIYNRIALDVAANKIEHVEVDENQRYVRTIDDGLNDCVSLEANLDQTSRAFFQDVVLSMLEDGVVAIVPVDTTLDPTKSASYDIQTIRVGKITQWMPKDVLINLYNEESGRREDIVLPKKMVAIIQNPFYAVMNEANSTL